MSVETKDQGPSSPMSFSLTYTLTIPERTNCYLEVGDNPPTSPNMLENMVVLYFPGKLCLVFCT